MNKLKETIFLPILILCGLGWLVFGQAVHFDFFNYDDYDYLFHTPFINPDWSMQSLVQIFNFSGTGNWHPLVWISLKLDRTFLGVEPYGYHLTNVVLHIVNGVILFLLIKRWTQSTWKSFFVAAFFLVHPQRAESVAWIVERKDVLSGFFFMLTFWAYTSYVKIQNKELKIKNFGWLGFFWYLSTLVLFTLGLLSKSMLVTVPFLMLLLDEWPLKRQNSFAIRLLEKIPFFILIFISSYVALLVRAEVSLDINEQVPLVTRLFNSIVFYALYMRDTFFPYPLTFYRIYPFDGFSLIWIILSSALILGMSILSLMYKKQAPVFFTGWFWFVGMLFPVIGLVHVGYAAYSDRYTYLPSIGLFIVLTWVACLLFEEEDGKKTKAFVFSGILLLAIFSFLGWAQTSLWKNSELLYKFSIKHDPKNYHLHEALCDYLADENRPKEAIEVCLSAVNNFPERAQASRSLGRLYFKQQRYNDAYSQFQKMVTIAMKERYKHEIDQKEQVEKKVQEFERIYSALKSRPKAEHPFYVLGNYWTKNRFYRLAIDSYKVALNKDPMNQPMHVNLGNAYFLNNNMDHAKKHFEIALQLNEDDINANYNLGLLFLKLSDYDSARSKFETILELEPDHSGAREKLSLIEMTK